MGVNSSKKLIDNKKVKKQSIWNNYNTDNFSSENPVNDFNKLINNNNTKELLSYLSESDTLSKNLEILNQKDQSKKN